MYKEIPLSHLEWIGPSCLDHMVEIKTSGKYGKKLQLFNTIPCSWSRDTWGDTNAVLYVWYSFIYEYVIWMKT